MKNKTKEANSGIVLNILVVLLCVLLFANLLILSEKLNLGETKKELKNRIVILDGLAINQTLKNYYDVEYYTDMEGLTIKIRNPCIFVDHGTGTSMQPYWEDEELFIVDSCYKPERLEVGDVVVWRHNNESYIHHRIISIDKDSRTFITKGDNLNKPDNYSVSFDDFMGKDIGVLNVLMEKIITDEVRVNQSEGWREGKDYRIRDEHIKDKNWKALCSERIGEF